EGLGHGPLAAGAVVAVLEEERPALGGLPAQESGAEVDERDRRALEERTQPLPEQARALGWVPAPRQVGHEEELAARVAARVQVAEQGLDDLGSVRRRRRGRLVHAPRVEEAHQGEPAQEASESRPGARARRRARWRDPRGAQLAGAELEARSLCA